MIEVYAIRKRLSHHRLHVIYFLVSVFEWTAKIFLCMTLIFFRMIRVTSVGFILLETLLKFCATNVFQGGICEAWRQCCAMCFTLFAVTSIHSIQKIKTKRNLETRSKMTLKIQLLKAQDKEIELIKEKLFIRRNWLILIVKVISILLLKSFCHQKR